MADQSFLPLVAEIVPECEPGMIPTQVTCAMAVVDDRNVVVMQVANAAGVHIVFLPADIAERVASHMLEVARAAQASRVGGLVLHAESGIIG